MTDPSGLETHANHANSQTTVTPNGAAAHPQRDAALKRALLFIGIAVASAGLAYAIVRATLLRAPTESDPTTERIQQLIDEANRLLKQLDDKKSG